jgi:uncharacterized protein YxeA
MKKIIMLLMFVSLMVVGCGKNQDSKTSSGTKNDSISTKMKDVKTETVTKDAKVEVNDVDGLIDSYEKVANKYIEANGKMKKSGGNSTLTAEMSDLSVKQIDLVGKLEHVKPNMTPKQLEKYTGISLKLENATK